MTTHYKCNSLSRFPVQRSVNFVSYRFVEKHILKYCMSLCCVCEKPVKSQYQSVTLLALEDAHGHLAPSTHRHQSEPLLFCALLVLLCSAHPLFSLLYLTLYFSFISVCLSKPSPLSDSFHFCLYIVLSYFSSLDTISLLPSLRFFPFLHMLPQQ